MKVHIRVKGSVLTVDVNYKEIEMFKSALLATPRRSFRSGCRVIKRSAGNIKTKAAYVSVPVSIRKKAMKMAKELSMSTGKSVSMSSCIAKLTA